MSSTHHRRDMKSLSADLRNDDLQMPQQLSAIKEKVKSTTISLQSYKPSPDASRIWDSTDRFKKLLEAALDSVTAASLELRNYSPDPQDWVSTIKPQSHTSEITEALDYEQEVAVHVLGVLIQSGYDIIQPSFNTYIHLITIGLNQGQPSVDADALSSITKAKQTMSVLDLLVDFEINSQFFDPAQFTLELDEGLLVERQKAMIEMFSEVCRYTMVLHETAFASRHLLAKGVHSIQKFSQASETMAKCWGQVNEAMRRMTRICPMYTDIVYGKFGRVLWHAASLMANIQDEAGLSEYLESGRVIPYGKDVVGDMTQSQIWLVGCADHLIKLASKLVRRVDSRAKAEPSSAAGSDIMYQLRSAIYDLVMISIGRASWLVSVQYRGELEFGVLNDLKNLGTKTLELVLDYQKSDSASEGGFSDEEGMEAATSSLQSSVISLCRQSRKKPFEPSEVVEKDSEESESVEFHEIGGEEKLATRKSVRAFPVTLEVAGSLEYDHWLPIFADIDKANAEKGDSQ